MPLEARLNTIDSACSTERLSASLLEMSGTAADTLAYLGGGVERDIHLVAGLLAERRGGGSEPRLDRACAQHLDLSRHSRAGDRAQQQCRPLSHLRSPRNRANYHSLIRRGRPNLSRPSSISESRAPLSNMILK